MTANFQPIVVTRPWAALIALALLVIPTVTLHRGLARRSPDTGDPALTRRRRGLAGLVIGKDGRASTSRFGVILWTFAVFYAAAFLLLFGRSLKCDSDEYKDRPRCAAAHEIRAKVTDNFLNRDLQPAYFVVLGFPVGAALAARAITGGRVQENKAYKRPIIDGRGSLAKAARELTGDDDGAADLLDAQYLAFNLLTMIYFLVELLVHPLKGLPDLPPTLLALSGVAAGAYTTNKALTEADDSDDDRSRAGTKAASRRPRVGAAQKAARA
jgi:hypothetical protein